MPSQELEYKVSFSETTDWYFETIRWVIHFICQGTGQLALAYNPTFTDLQTGLDTNLLVATYPVYIHNFSTFTEPEKRNILGSRQARIQDFA